MDNDVLEILLYIGIPLLLLLSGLVIGKTIESAHFRRLTEREQELSGIMMSDIKQLPANWHASEPVLVVGQAVIATDYFKVFVAGLRNFFGGRVRGYEALMERARRQAIVRMLEEAQDFGANVVWNVRLETSTIQGKRERNSAGVEVMAYGTAMRVTG